jgi:hypothetical protein
MHETPRDFFRYTRFGLESLLAQNGFQVAATEQRGGFWSVIIQLASDHGYPAGRKYRLLSALGDRLWGCLQWAAAGLDRGREDPNYALGWTLKAFKKQPGREGDPKRRGRKKQQT